MPLVPAKCPECGGNVVVDSEKEAWICDFCKTPFVVEKAINTFNTINNITNNVTNNNEIKAEIVNVYEGGNIEEKLENARVFFEVHGDIDQAIKLYEEIVSVAPDKHEAWFEFARIKGKGFQIDESKGYKRIEKQLEAKPLIDHACSVAPLEVAVEYKIVWNSFIQEAETYLENKKTINQHNTAIKQQRVKELQVKIERISNMEEQLERLIKKRSWLKRDIESMIVRTGEIEILLAEIKKLGKYSI